MTDPYLPPPRRSMPDELRHRIAGEIAAAPVRRRRTVSVLIPLVAAVVVAAMVVVGVTAVRDREHVGPAETAGPVTATPVPTPRPTRSATPTSTATTRTVLDVRPMTRSEIAADTRSCTRDEGPGPDLPHQGEPKVRYAMVQRTAGAAGAGSAVRALLLEDEIGSWDCVDGQQMGWSRGARASEEPSSRVPVAPVANSVGGSGASCSRKGNVVRSSGTFSVGRAVEVGRVRVLRGDKPGPWMTIQPVRGFVHILLTVTDPAADERNVGMEFTFLDREGRTVPIASRFGDQKSTTSIVEELFTCADSRARYPRSTPKPLVRPSSDAAGIRICREMLEESAVREDMGADREWRSRVLVSTDDEWGTVLSDGRNLVGCSLYPTKEISPLIPDTPTVRRSAFFFAVNPIGDTGASSLWAAGRVPTDVSAITYRLPGDREVAATISERGYWMLKHHSGSGESIGSEESSRDWPPVLVTVTRPSGTQRYTIPFTEETMCRQVSHGC
jgi:hypothetical protein